jgi:CheY-like chemotaxis protein
MRPARTTVRVALAEDGVLLREGLAGLLDRFGFEVAAAVGDAEALVTAVAEHAPDLVITDIRMPPTTPTRGCAQPSPAPRPARAGRGRAQPVRRAEPRRRPADSGDGGRVGYLLKDRVVDVEEFRRCAAPGRGRRHRDRPRGGAAPAAPPSRPVVAAVLARARGARPHRRGPFQRRHRRQLVISEAAVGKHVGNILAKLDLPPNDDTSRRVMAVLAYLRSDVGPLP